MSTWLVSTSELTPSQLRAVQLDPFEHRVISGPPGSGKTQVLLHRARYLCDRYGVPPERLHIFVFTNVLKEYIRSALDLLDIPRQCVSTFYSWCCTFYRRYINDHLPLTDDGLPDFARVPGQILHALPRLPVTLPLYDIVMVDEGQDLDGSSFELLRLIARHVTVCIDHKQQIYSRGASESEILDRLGLRRHNIALLDALRCCPFVARLSAAFIPDPTEREHYLNQVRTYQGEKETPLLYYAADFEDEKSRLIEVIRIRLHKNEKVAVLFPLKRQVYGFAQALREANLQVEIMEEADFGSNHPKLLTYHSAKGLTFDSILMPRLVPSSFRKKKDAEVSRLLFVGISRATKWVFLSTLRDKQLPVLQQLRSLEDEGVLTVRYRQEIPPPAARSGLDKEPEEENPDLMDLL